MSGWDFVFAGLELLTYNEARKAQQNLKEMKTAQEISRAQMALLQAMRNFIFDIARDIQLAEPNIDAYPQQVYIVANTLGWRLHDSGLVPEMFPEFSEKDYVFKTQNKIVEVAGRCQRILTQAQIQQSELAVRYISDMPLLIRATKAKWSSEQIQATQAKWDRITKENNARTSSGCLNALGIAGVLFGAMVLCGVGESIANSLAGLSSNETIQTILRTPTLGITYLLSIAAMGAGIYFFGKKLYVVFGTKSDPEGASLRQKREEWNNNLMTPDEWEQVKITLGGDLSSEQFRKVIKERLAFLEPIMGSEYVNTLLPGK
jgi:hypothetical protein